MCWSLKFHTYILYLIIKRDKIVILLYFVRRNNFFVWIIYFQIQLSPKWTIHRKNLSKFNFVMGFILFYANPSICKNKKKLWICGNSFKELHIIILIKKLNICNIPLSESEGYDIWWILSMYSLLRVSLYITIPSYKISGDIISTE